MTSPALRIYRASPERAARIHWGLGLKLGTGLALLALCAACAKGAAPGAVPEQKPTPEPMPAAAPPPAPETELLEESAPSDASEDAEPHADIPQRSRLEESDQDDELAQAEQALAQADTQLQSLAHAPPAQAPAGAGAGAPKPKKRGASAARDCETTCKAFASLVRARDAICRIAGQDNERCARANDIVERRERQRDACACKR
jgi:hypothetical protein